MAIILLVGDEICLLEQFLLMMLKFPDHSGGIWSSAVGDVKWGLIMREEVVDVSCCQFLSGSTFSSGSAPTRPTSCTPACRRKSARTYTAPERTTSTSHVDLLQFQQGPRPHSRNATKALITTAIAAIEAL